MTKRKKLSDANYEIMKIVWDRGEVSVNEVLDAVNSKRGKKVKRSTIQTQMQRLEQYGWLKSRKIKREFLFSPVLSREKANERFIKNARKKMFRDSPFEMAKCLFSNSDISLDELKKIEKLLSQIKKKKP